MNISKFLNQKEYNNKYIFIGNNQLTKQLLDRYLGDYEVSNILPKGGLLNVNRLIKNEDFLSRDFSDLDREYKFVILADKRDGRRKIFKSAKEKEIVDTTLEENKKFINSQIRAKLGITKKQAEKLIESKKEIGLIYNEIQKLKHLPKNLIIKYVANLEVKEEKDIFNFLNALFTGGDYYKYLNKLSDHPIKIIYMINIQLRGLIICKEQSGNISKKYGLHPYQVKIFKQQARTYSLDSLLTMFKLSCEYDRKIKTGQVSPEVALDYICSYIYVEGGV